jgi:hypothetical protein
MVYFLATPYHFRSVVARLVSGGVSAPTPRHTKGRNISPALYVPLDNMTMQPIREHITNACQAARLLHDLAIQFEDIVEREIAHYASLRC